MSITPQMGISKQHGSGFKASDHARGQGVPRAESGAYTIVREHFRPRDNAAIGCQTGFLTHFYRLAAMAAAPSMAARLFLMM